MYEDVPADPSLADPLPDSPLGLLDRWLVEARQRAPQGEPWVMSVASVDEALEPTSRTVLCRGYDATRGYLVFYTNRESPKGRHFDARPRAAALLHWFEMQRQIRVEGPVDLLPDAESDAYFASRPRPAQIAAWASRQSAPTSSREALLAALAEQDARFEGQDRVPRPPFWGGYRIWAERVELWVGSMGRAHDRGLWTRELTRGEDGFDGSAWKVARLQP